MKLKCFWCVLRILEWMKQFSSACNTAVRGDESDCIASILRLRSGTNKQQYSGCRNWLNPETLCTIFCPSTSLRVTRQRYFLGYFRL